MEYKANNNPSVFINPQNGAPYPFEAEEEVFIILNREKNEMISIDFEKRRLASRCIVRLISYQDESISEVSAITPKFKIKSTFAPLPFEKSGITFQGGGFTASAVAKDGEIGLIISAPLMLLGDGRKGLHVEMHMKNDKEAESFNCIVFEKNRTESLHASNTHSVEGMITIDEKKTSFKGKSLSGRHIWKHTFLTRRKEQPIAIIYKDDEDEPTSIIFHHYSKYASIFSRHTFKVYKNVEWTGNEASILFSNNEDTEVEAKVFASIHKKGGPFRKANTFRYAKFSGHIGNKSFSDAPGYIEYPD